MIQENQDQYFEGKTEKALPAVANQQQEPELTQLEPIPEYVKLAARIRALKPRTHGSRYDPGAPEEGSP